MLNRRLFIGALALGAALGLSPLALATEPATYSQQAFAAAGVEVDAATGQPVMLVRRAQQGDAAVIGVAMRSTSASLRMTTGFSWKERTTSAPAARWMRASAFAPSRSASQISGRIS